VVGQVRVLDVRAADPVWPPTGAYVEAWFSPTGSFAWHTETMAEGGCRLLEFEPGFCEDFCDGVCRAPGVCEPWPAYQSAGTLTVEGTREPLSLTPSPSGSYLLALTVDGPLFDDGDVVSVGAGGDAFPAFAGEVAGPDALTAADPVGSETLDVPWTGDFTITWPDPVAGSAIRARLTVGGNAHGQPNPFVVDCDAVDAGSIAIPASLLEPLGTFSADLSKGRDRSAFELTRSRSTFVDTDEGPVEVVAGRTFLYAAQRLPE
jgi:hypothetical protein